VLRQLSIRHVVLIDALDLAFDNGLCVLTGETGAGKSILLDALGLALGARANAALVQSGQAEAMVTAALEPAHDHPAWALAQAHGIDTDDGVLLLRRTLREDGKSRAFVNDHPVTAAFLRTLGEALIEIEGQSDRRGLLDPTTHRELLDAWGGTAGLADTIGTLWDTWRDASTQHAEAIAEMAQAAREEEFLRHVVAELDTLAPEEGEEARLDEERGRLRNGRKIADALSAAAAEIASEGGVAGRLRAAHRAAALAAKYAGPAVEPAVDALDRAAVEAMEAEAQLSDVIRSLDLDPARLDSIEERLFTLRGAARKHTVSCDRLPAVHSEMTARLAAIDGGEATIAGLAAAEVAALAAYDEAATKLTKKREAAAKKLDRAVTGELPPLKLGNARFTTAIEPLDDDTPARYGRERVRFTVATNPGSAFGPLDQVASGGERARFLLALKVCLAAVGGVPTVVFDEVDSGIGGAVADAVGLRLARLADAMQVLVITHSPQVAARAVQHMVVAKAESKGAARTGVTVLADEERREEIARMLSGARITDEARAAADSLMDADGA
jgi:DNA repair protein RecN (Recombination protein N)